MNKWLELKRYKEIFRTINLKCTDITYIKYNISISKISKNSIILSNFKEDKSVQGGITHTKFLQDLYSLK